MASARIDGETKADSRWVAKGVKAGEGGRKGGGGGSESGRKRDEGSER